MPRPSSEHRTNSLAFAKTDCHTCTANNRRCDRKRPRCSSCTCRDIVCGGYPMQLIWSKKSKPTQPRPAVLPEQADDPFYLEPLSLQASIHVNARNSRCRSHYPRKFRFVSEQAPGRKHTRGCSGEIQEHHFVQQDSIPTETSTNQSDLCNTLADGVHASSPRARNENSDLCDLLSMFPQVNFPSDSNDWWSWSSTSPMNIGIPNTLGEPGIDCNTVATLSSLENAVEEHSSLTAIPGDSWHDLVSFGSPVLHNSLYAKFETLIHMYDQDFCVVPLSWDVPSNPFRCQLDTSDGSQSLLHAVLAVSCYHAGRQASKDDYPLFEVFDHHKTAMKLYRDELDTYTGPEGIQLLDTTMVLFLFNATQAAFGNWASHISDAQRLLKLSGGTEIWIGNRRVQAQVVMLLWWDATIALLSRQGCLLPYSYFESLLALEDDRYWSFFDLIGCPRELVVPVMQLANLAEENEKASSMRWTKFDLTLVDEIEASIFNFKNPKQEIHENMSEEQIQQQCDRWNCTEAWRYGLLIYITRVFRWNRNIRPPFKLTIYARSVFEHVHSCRQTAIIQKQILIPLFFAGCETKDQFWRQSILNYCQYWDRFSGYNLFSTASSLLEDVWSEEDRSHSHETWWGSVIDKKQQSYQSHIAPMQFCFG